MTETEKQTSIGGTCARILCHTPFPPEETKRQELPCRISCPKCGGSDICRKHRVAGETWDKYNLERERNNDFVRSKGLCYYAKLECITHHCRECEYEWETPTADQHEAK
jgi:hypothetical protein